MTIASTTDARRLHYGHLYGLIDPPGDGPFALVVGNCQAESLRLFLSPSLHAIRMPAVHEIVRADLPFLDRWLRRAELLVTQPIRDDYHDLPLGSGQLAARLRSGATTITVPVIRFAGLYPGHALVRPPRDASLTPPLVEYHDLRVLAEAADRLVERPGSTRRPRAIAIDDETVRAIADDSLAELRRREESHSTVLVSDVFAEPRFELMRTINHPGNPVWSMLAARVHEGIGLPDPPVDPGRPVLTSVSAPREEAVIDAWNLADEPTDHWIVEGRVVSVDEVRDAHLEWYARNPDVVEAGILRHDRSLRLLGLR